MTPTHTEQRIIELVQSGNSTAKAISLDLGWGEDASNVRKYLKQMSEKGYIQVVPQKIVVPETGEEV